MTRERNFRKPTLEQVQEYLDEKGETRFTAQEFCDYYDTVGWIVGRGKKMKDWHGAVRLWISNRNKKANEPKTTTHFETPAERIQRMRDEHNREFREHIMQKLARARMHQ